MSLSANDIYLLNRMNGTAEIVQLGTQLDAALAQVSLAEAAAADAVAAQAAAEAAQTAVAATVADLSKLCAKATYDFDIHGGAIGDIGLGVTIPNNAIVTNVTFDVLDAPTSSGLATVAGKLQTAADLLAATAIASLTALKQGKPDNVLADYIKLTAAHEIKLTVAAFALTAGKINVFVEYLLSDAHV